MNPPSSLPSSDPQVTGEALSSFISEQARQMADQIRSHAMFTSEFTSGSRQVLSELRGLASDISAVRAEISQSSGAPGISQGSATDPTTGRARPSPPPRMPSPPRAPVDEGRSSAPSSPPMTYSEGLSRGENLRMGDVIQSVARFGQRFVSAHTPSTWDRSPDGALITQYVNGELSYVKQDPGTGQILSHMPVNAPGAIRAVARSDAMANRFASVSGALGRYGAGEGVLGAIGGSAAKLAGPIGITVGVAQQIGDKIGEQTAAGAPWRQIYGEDAGRFAIEQRSRSWLAGLDSFLSGTGFGRGREDYQAMAQLGLQGTGLDNAVNFSRQMYLSHGMDSRTSAQFVQMSRDTAVSLETLSAQIEKVGEAAVAAGQNSEKAISSFAAASQSLRSGGVSAAGSSAAAASIDASVREQLPTSLASDQTVSAISGSVNQQNLMLYAARTGQDWRRLSQNLSTDVTGRVASTIAQGTITDAVDRICGAAGTNRAALAAEISAKYPGVTHLSPAQQNAILANHLNINGYTIGQIFQGMGLNIAADQQMNMFFETVMGNVDVTSGIASGTKPLTGEAYNGDPASIFSALAGGWGTDNQSPSAALMGSSSTSIWGNASVAGDVANAYLDYAKSTGYRSPLIESVIGGEGAKTIMDFAGTDSLDDVKVNTSKGQMTLAQLISDQSLVKSDLATGQASVVGGGEHANDEPMDLSSIVSGGSAPGTVASGVSGQGQSWTLSLTPEAQRIFSLVGPTAAERSGAPAVGSMSPSSYGGWGGSP